MLMHILREYNVNKIFLSRLGLWPFQSKLVRNSLPFFCLIFEISYYPFEVMCTNIQIVSHNINVLPHVSV